jgi:hypothetical protein
VLGGTTSDFTGDGATWTRQHGHHLIGPDRLLFFNNEVLPETSRAIEVSLDFESMTATRVWEHSDELEAQIYGDVQRLENGNTLITYTTSRTILEVAPDDSIVRAVSWENPGVPGYAMQRSSLYGPPPVQ